MYFIRNKYTLKNVTTEDVFINWYAYFELVNVNVYIDAAGIILYSS
jgi:hypothetical protein